MMTAVRTSAAVFCGDGIVQVGEECDDGNEEGRDGYDAACGFECRLPATVKRASIAGGSMRLTFLWWGFLFMSTRHTRSCRLQSDHYGGLGQYGGAWGGRSRCTSSIVEITVGQDLA